MNHRRPQRLRWLLTKEKGDFKEDEKEKQLIVVLKQPSKGKATAVERTAHKRLAANSTRDGGNATTRRSLGLSSLSSLELSLSFFLLTTDRLVVRFSPLSSTPRSFVPLASPFSIQTAVS